MFRRGASAMRGLFRGAVGSLHRGELGAMVLAQEAAIGQVALDDILARRKAKQMGLHPIGTLGILLLARNRGILDGGQARANIEELVEVHGMYTRLMPLFRFSLANDGEVLCQQ